MQAHIPLLSLSLIVSTIFQSKISGEALARMVLSHSSILSAYSNNNSKDISSPSFSFPSLMARLIISSLLGIAFNINSLIE